MARLGRSPQVAEATAKQPRKITLTTITHIPHLLGFYKDHMKISELCFNSMITNATSEGRLFDFVVLDQGSCLEWRQKLISWHASGLIDDLILLNDNIGKLEALRKLLSYVKSDIFGYTDDDVLFYPKWLDQHMKLLGTFKGCKLVTGSPIITRFKWYPKQLKTMEKDKDITVRVLDWKDYPRDWMEDDALCRGIPMDRYIEICESAVEGQIVPIQVKDKVSEAEGWAVGHHMQLLGDREVLLNHLPPPKVALMGFMREWDVNMDKAGSIQLATLERTCRHMGNVLDNSIVDDALQMELVL
jgi:hypothetical protein